MSQHPTPDPKPDAGRPPAGTAEAMPNGERKGSDPPKQSGHPAARRAGEGADTVKPADPSEIDRSTDA